ncbi:glutathione peroxidase 7 isoform X2 [Vulpes vulpes]|uniref:Glutathione peroxidase 7 isoform X2 n=1 Tax=Vulpes vulpes TaxID=9627 RepID=A0ABM4XPT2_VULVU
MAVGLSYQSPPRLTAVSSPRRELAQRGRTGKMGLGVAGGECGQRVRLHGRPLPGPAAAAEGPGAPALHGARLPLQPVRPAGARRRPRDRELRPPHLRRFLPHVQQGRGHGHRGAPGLQVPDPDFWEGAHLELLEIPSGPRWKGSRGLGPNCVGGRYQAPDHSTCEEAHLEEARRLITTFSPLPLSHSLLSLRLPP